MTILLHTSDWHLGKTFYMHAGDPARQERLRLARFAAVEELGRVARAEGASAVLVAGDVFHTSAVSDRVVVQALDAIGRIGLPVIAIPGNHDHGGPGSLWERPVFLEQKERRAPNLTVLLGPPCLHTVEDVEVLAIPVMDRFQPVRLRDLAPLASSSHAHVGLVHASLGEFNEDGNGRSLQVDGAEDLGLAYLALGDYHRRQQINGLPMPAWYAGTHEPDNFPSHHQAGMREGGCLRVDVAAGRPAAVRELALAGGLRWSRLVANLHGEAELQRLEHELRALSEGRAQRTLCSVNLDGSELGYAGMERLRALQTGLDADFELLVLEGEVREAPTEDELAALAGRPGLVGAAAQRLHEMASDPTRAAVARAALSRLYRAAGA